MNTQSNKVFKVTMAYSDFIKSDGLGQFALAGMVLFAILAAYTFFFNKGKDRDENLKRSAIVSAVCGAGLWFRYSQKAKSY